MAEKKSKKGGGSKKHGRNKRVKDQATSALVRNRITTEKYLKEKGLTTHHNYIRNITVN